jgi:phosphoribosylanthranilate isomerase
MARTRVKICGITRPEDAQEAARLGADALGLVFYSSSPRAVTVERARHIVDGLPPFVTVVGLFVNAEPREIRAALEAVPIDLLQFHGDEPPEACRGYGRRYVKAVTMTEDVDLAAMALHYGDAAALLLDTPSPRARGGTGESFDWSRVPSDVGKSIVLAGGLNPDNVAEAIQVARPYGVDVSSGVELAKGIKDAAKMAAFMRGVDSVTKG